MLDITKGIYIFTELTPERSEEVQNWLFKQGCTWRLSGNVPSYLDKSEILLRNSYIWCEPTEETKVEATFITYPEWKAMVIKEKYNSDFSDAKVGDLVTHVVYGHGEITTVGGNTIVVEFKNTYYDFYLTGKESRIDIHPGLVKGHITFPHWTSEPTPTLEKQIEEIVKASITPEMLEQIKQAIGND